MDQQATEEQIAPVKLEPTAGTDGESNNNDENNEVKTSFRPSVFSILRGDNEDLDSHQFGEDDDYNSEEPGCLSRYKKLALDSTAKRSSGSPIIETNGTNNGRQRSVDDCFSSNEPTDDGYSNEYSNGSDNKGTQSNTDENDRQRQHQSDEPEQMRKLFIGGLDYKTSEETLKQHFKKFGDVTDCVVMREPQSKRSRGFGFVIYANSMMVDKAQDARPHEVDGREVQSKRAISREDSGKPEAQATVKKVYLGGLSDDIEELELREYFKNFGNIVNINIVAHKDTGKRRGFAFVEFDDYDPVDKIVLKKFHTIREKRIEAKKAIPKVEMDARKRVDPRAAMANAMVALSGPPLEGPVGGRPRSGRSGTAACLWDGGPYNPGGYPTGYASQANHGYPLHYHAQSANYGAASGWMMHGGAQGGSGNPYGYRGTHGGGAYGRHNYSSQAGSWTTAVDYGAFPASQGGAGPMRLNYQHRSWGPYGGGYGAQRGRGYNP